MFVHGVRSPDSEVTKVDFLAFQTFLCICVAMQFSEFGWLESTSSVESVNILTDKEF